MDKRLSVYMKYGEKADTCSIFEIECPNGFEICPIRIVYGRNNLNIVECSRILVEILRASRSRFYHKHMYNCREDELKFIREPLWHVKRCIIRYFHIVILSYLFIFKKYILLFYLSLLLLYISLFIFNIRSFLLHIFHLYSIFYHLYFIIFITILPFFLFLLYITTFVFYVWPFVFIDVILLFYLPLFLFFTDAYLYQISFPFLFYTVNTFVLYTLFTFLQAISLAKLSRSSSSLDRLTSDRTNTKTDRL